MLSNASALNRIYYCNFITDINPKYIVFPRRQIKVNLCTYLIWKFNRKLYLLKGNNNQYEFEKSLLNPGGELMLIFDAQFGSQREFIHLTLASLLGPSLFWYRESRAMFTRLHVVILTLETFEKVDKTDGSPFNNPADTL